MLAGLKRAPRIHHLLGHCCAWRIPVLGLLLLFLAVAAETTDTTKTDNINQLQSPGFGKAEEESKDKGSLKKFPERADGIWKSLEDELGALAGRADHDSEPPVLNTLVLPQPSSKETADAVKEKVNASPATETLKAATSASLETEATATPKGESEREKDGSDEASIAASTGQPLACPASGVDVDGSNMYKICTASKGAGKLQHRVLNTFVAVPKGSTLVDYLLYGLPPPCEELSLRHVQKAILEELKGDGQILTEQKVVEVDQRPARLKPLGLDEYKRTMEKHVLQKERNESTLVAPPPPPRRASTDGAARYNYAAAANGAKVVAANKEAKGPSAVLDEDKDKYLRNPCSADEKWIVIELSEEILVDVVVISNYEFYSSNPKDFEVLGSQRFPTDEWMSLGTFHAVNVRTPQHFPIVQPRVWIRYMMLRMLTQHGSEVYCTLSLVRVHGVDALQEFKEEMELMSAEVEKVVNVLRESSPPGSAILTPSSPETPPNTPGTANTGKASMDSKSATPAPDGGSPGGTGTPPQATNLVDSKKGDTGGTSNLDSGTSSGESTPATASGGGGRPAGTAGTESGSSNAPLENGAGGVGVSEGGSSSQLDAGELNVAGSASATSKGESSTSEGGSVGGGTSTPSGGVGVQASRPPTGDFIFKTLMQKIKSLELNQSIFDRYVEDLNQKYLEMFGEIEGDIANLEGGLRNATSMVQTLRTRLAERDARATSELEALRLDMMTQLGTITSELTALRLHSARMEKREAAAIGTSLLCVLVSAIFYCIGVLRSNGHSPSVDPTDDADDDVPSKVQRRGMAAPNFCYGAAVMILFVGTSFITLILSV